MKQWMLIVVLLAGFGLSQDRIPVTTISGMQGIFFPAPTYQLSTSTCLDTIAELILVPDDATTTEELSCYFVQLEPEETATFIFELTAQLRQQGYTLVFEHSILEEGLVNQLWLDEQEINSYDIIYDFNYAPDLFIYVISDTPDSSPIDP